MFIPSGNAPIVFNKEDCKTWLNNYLHVYDDYTAEGDSAKINLAIFLFENALRQLPALSCSDAEIYARIYFKLGNLHKLQTNWQTATEYYQKTIPYANEYVQKGGSYKTIAACYSNAGYCYWMTGDDYNAISYFQKAVQLFKPTDSLQLSTTYAWLADAYKTTEQTDSTLYYYRIAHQYNPHNEEATIQCAKFFSDIAADRTHTYYAKANDTLPAFVIRLTQLLQQQAIPDQDSTGIAEIYHTLAKIATSQKNYPLAHQYFTKAYSFAAVLGSQHDDYAKIPVLRGNLYLAQKQFSKAQQFYDLALHNLAPVLTNLPIDSLLDTTKKYHNLLPLSELWLFDALHGKCTTFNKAGQKQEALKWYKATLNYAVQLALNYQADKSIINFNQSIRQTYQEAIELSIQQNDINQAFNLVEQSKAFILRTALQNRRALKFGGIPDTILWQEREYYKQIANLEKHITLDNKVKYSDTLLTLKQQQWQFIKNLEKQYPAYYELKYKLPQIDIGKLQQQIESEQALIAYFMGNKSAYTFTITRQKATIDTILIDTDFIHKLQDFILLIQTNSNSNNEQKLNRYPQLAYEWYQLLLEKQLSSIDTSQIKRLCIIPDAQLGYLPFEILITQPQNRWTDASDSLAWQNEKMPLLLKKFAISYQYSATLPTQTQVNDLNARISIENKNKQLISFGLDYQNTNIASLNYMPDKGNLASRRFGYLSNAPTEATQVAQIMGGKSYLNEQATVNNFLRSSQYSILHLAMHGIIDDKNPLNSALLFLENDSIKPLTAGEIYGQQLQIGLAVLSACNSGSGKIEKGEGIMSLARAFVFAGCNSLVMSLWEVSDVSTPTIMEHFYKQLKKGKTKDIALQQAKLNYLKEADFHKLSPFHWAAFVAIGDMRAVETTTKHYYCYWIIVGVLIAVGIFWVWRRKGTETK